MFTVLVCGDRNYKDSLAIGEKLKELKNEHPDINVVHGACRGADMISDFQCRILGIPTSKYPANWDELGIKAGVVRNQQMLDEGKPDLVIAFHDNIKASKGTKDMVRRAKKAGVNTLVLSHY